MEDMQTMLQLQLTGTMNGQDTRVTISIDSEESFDIRDMGVQEDAQEQAQEAATDGEGSVETEGDDYPTSVSTESPTEPETAEEPETPDIDPEEMPPMTAGTKQFKVGKVVLQGNEWMPARDILSTLDESDDPDEWNRSIVTSHIHSLIKKGVLDRRKDESLGVYEYKLTDMGYATLTHATAQGE